LHYEAASSRTVPISTSTPAALLAKPTLLSADGRDRVRCGRQLDADPYPANPPHSKAVRYTPLSDAFEVVPGLVEVEVAVPRSIPARR